MLSDIFQQEIQETQLKKALKILKILSKLFLVCLCGGMFMYFHNFSFFILGICI